MKMKMVRKDVSQEESRGVDSMLLLGKATADSDQNHDEDEDQESGASSEEFVESPKSVVAKKTSKKILMGKNTSGGGFVHSQILRIRQEDSHLGEHIGEGFNANINYKTHHSQYKDSINSLLVFPRTTILPSSPLSGKTALN